MARIKIIENFSGGPRGRTEYTAGQMVELPDDEAKLYVEKGHAVEVTGEATQRKKVGEK